MIMAVLYMIINNGNNDLLRIFSIFKVSPAPCRLHPCGKRGAPQPAAAADEPHGYQ
jgi:hypothetical protein